MESGVVFDIEVERLNGMVWCVVMVKVGMKSAYSFFGG